MSRLTSPDLYSIITLYFSSEKSLNKFIKEFGRKNIHRHTTYSLLKTVKHKEFLFYDTQIGVIYSLKIAWSAEIKKIKKKFKLKTLKVVSNKNIKKVIKYFRNKHITMIPRSYELDIVLSPIYLSKEKFDTLVKLAKLENCYDKAIRLYHENGPDVTVQLAQSDNLLTEFVFKHMPFLTEDTLYDMTERHMMTKITLVDRKPEVELTEKLEKRIRKFSEL